MKLLGLLLCTALGANFAATQALAKNSTHTEKIKQNNEYEEFLGANDQVSAAPSGKAPSLCIGCTESLRGENVKTRPAQI
jgi:hypothetical protein